MNANPAVAEARNHKEQKNIFISTDGVKYSLHPVAPGATAADFTWALDPIDGTRAFAAGLPVWGRSIEASTFGAPGV